VAKKSKINESEINMYNVVPHKLVKSDIAEDKMIILLKPKFRNSFLVKHLLHRMKYPDFKTKLDEIGTAVWNKIDGKKNAVEIGNELEKELGEKIQPVYERLGMFLSTMKREKFIEY